MHQMRIDGAQSWKTVAAVMHSAEWSDATPCFGHAPHGIFLAGHSKFSKYRPLEVTACLLLTLDWCCTSCTMRINRVIVLGLILQEGSCL